MSYTNSTNNLNLPQWQNTDKPKFDDFNTAFANIEKFSEKFKDGYVITGIEFKSVVYNSIDKNGENWLDIDANSNNNEEYNTSNNFVIITSFYNDLDIFLTTDVDKYKIKLINKSNENISSRTISYFVIKYKKVLA